MRTEHEEDFLATHVWGWTEWADALRREPGRVAGQVGLEVARDGYEDEDLDHHGPYV